MSVTLGVSLRLPLSHARLSQVPAWAETQVGWSAMGDGQCCEVVTFCQVVEWWKWPAGWSGW